MSHLRSAAAATCTGFALLLLGACSEDPATQPAGGSPQSERYRYLGDNLGSTIALVKSSATAAGAITPADLAEVARVPGSLTGNTDIGAEQNGKTGDKAANIDSDSGEETLTVFVPDAPTGGGTSASLPSFVAWRGDAASNDQGLCYLGWTKGATWVVASTCGNTTGAWVCQITSDDAVCNACNTAGDCVPCTMSESRFSCQWP